MQDLRQALEAQGISADAAKVIESSTSQSTKAQYRPHIQRWRIFAAERGEDPLNGSVSTVINFLAEQMKRGLGYSSLNTARSAIASITLGGENSLGNHPLIKKFMKGAFNLKPALPRNTVSWDPEVVLNKLRMWSPARKLTLKQLTKKLLMLMLLLSAQRGQIITALDTRNMDPKEIENNTPAVTFTIGELMKTSTNRDHTSEVRFKAFPPDRRLCVVRYLKEYRKRTEKYRENNNKLFLSYKTPHNEVGRDTIA